MATLWRPVRRSGADSGHSDHQANCPDCALGTSCRQLSGQRPVSPLAAPTLRHAPGMTARSVPTRSRHILVPMFRLVAAVAVLLLAGQLTAVTPAAAAATSATHAGADQGDSEVHNVLERFPTDRLRWSLADIFRDGGIKVSYNTSKLRHSGEWIRVSWSGVPRPHPLDLLAVYSPPDAYRAGAAPIKFANASDAEGHLSSGSGALDLRLVNMRSNLRVVFIRGDAEEPTVVAVGSVIRNVNPNEPTGIHLMRTRRPTQMMVQFTSRDSKAPVVRYGTRPGALTFTLPATTTTYTRTDMCGPPATREGFISPGLLHTAVMTGLQPGETYYYRVGDAETDEYSEQYSFRAPPPVGPNTTVHILALADQGVGEVDGSYAAMEYRAAADVAALTVAEGLRGPPGGQGGQGDHYSLVLHAGDISYARGYGGLWDAFLFQQQELAARVPYMTCIGNHERDHPGQGMYPMSVDSGGECGIPYEARFPMPTPAPDQPWYSFDHGPIHFTVMSTEHYFDAGSAQRAWLAADLAGVDRSRTPWLVLVGHRPVYIDANEYGEQGKQTSAMQLQVALEQLLAQYGVDLALSGHHHSYQRTCRVQYKECQEQQEQEQQEDGQAGEAGGQQQQQQQQQQQRGTVHLCVGHAGADFYDNGFDPQPAWVKYEAQLTHGYARLHVNATHLHIQAIDSANGEVFDEAVLTKQVAQRSARSVRGSVMVGKPLSLYGREVWIPHHTRS